MSNAESRRVLIVGAGIGGLALAKALERRGIVPDIAEKHSGPPSFGASLYLPGNAARALRSIGVLDDVVRLGHRIRRQEFYGADAKLLNTVDVDRFWSDEAPCLAIERNVLRAVLEGSLQRSTVRYGWYIDRLEHRHDGVRASFVDGTSERYDLIVGCDGVDSQLRRHMFPDSKPRFCGQVCWRAIVENVTAFSNWHVLLGQNLTLLAVALPNSKLYLYADTTVPDVQHAPGSPTALLRRCPPPFAACAEAFEKSDTGYRSPVEEVTLDEWHRPNLLLIGDAAHASRPNMAQGAAMAIEDAQVLADMLATSAPSEALSRAFVARRRQRVDWVQKQTHARDRLRSSPSLIRHTVLRLAAKRLHDRSYTPLRAAV